MAQKKVGSLYPTGVQNDIAQNEKRQSIPYTITAAEAATTIDILFDFQTTQSGQLFSAVRTMFVDNRKNPSEMIVDVAGPNQSFPIPPYSAGYFTVSSSTEAKEITVTSVGGATDSIYMEFFNYGIPPVVWSGFAPFIPGIEVVTKPAVGAYVNRNRTMAAAAAANIFPAVATPTQKWLKNMGPDILYINLTVAATGSPAAGDLTILVGQVFNPEMTYGTAISGYSTAGCDVEAYEF